MIRRNLSLDVDGVLCNPVPSVLDIVNDKYGTHYQEKDIKKFDQCLDVPRLKILNTVIGTKKLQLGPLFRKYTNDYDFVMSLKPLDVCKESLWFLNDIWDINIHSTRPKESLPYLEEWFEVNDLPYNSITLDSGKDSGDVLIDDYDKNLLKFNNTKILFKHNWSINSTKTLDLIDEGEIIVCENWNQVYDQLDKIHHF